MTVGCLDVVNPHWIDERTSLTGLFADADQFTDSMAVHKVTTIVLWEFANFHAVELKNRSRIERRNVMNGVAIVAVEKPTFT